jgi:CheY-like chemotaxis protein
MVTEETRTEAATPLRILVIEDDADIREALADVLRDEAMEVLAAPDGRAALDALLAGYRADLILLDLMMPGMTGWEFRAQQRSAADPAVAAIPVAVVSACGRPEDRATLDALAFLDKPLGLEALGEIRRLAGEARRRRAG